MDNFADYSPGNGTPNDHAQELSPKAEFDLGTWPFKNIWTSPRITIRRIVDVDPELHANLLVILAGISESLDRASTKNSGDKLSLGAIIFLILIISPIMSLLGVWIYSHLIRITGKWIDGHGGYLEIKAAIAWAALPTVAGLVLWIPLLLAFGKEMFTEEMPSVEANLSLLLLLVIIATVQMILGIWAFILLCNTIAEVQGYRSAWKGLGNILLSGLIVIVPIVLFIFAMILLVG